MATRIRFPWRLRALFRSQSAKFILFSTSAALVGWQFSPVILQEWKAIWRGHLMVEPGRLEGIPGLAKVRVEKQLEREEIRRTFPGGDLKANCWSKPLIRFGRRDWEVVGPEDAEKGTSTGTGTGKKE